jgi:hypothetical protein
MPLQAFDPTVHLIAARFTAAIESGNPDRIRAMLMPDATIWYGYRGPEGVIMGVEEAIATIVGMRVHVADFRYIQACCVPTDRGYLQMSRIRSVSKRGTVIHVPVALEAEVDSSSRLASYREWIDIRHLQPFFAELQGLRR